MRQPKKPCQLRSYTQIAVISPSNSKSGPGRKLEGDTAIYSAARRRTHALGLTNYLQRRAKDMPASPKVLVFGTMFSAFGAGAQLIHELEAGHRTTFGKRARDQRSDYGTSTNNVWDRYRSRAC